MDTGNRRAVVWPVLVLLIGVVLHYESQKSNHSESHVKISKLIEIIDNEGGTKISANIPIDWIEMTSAQDGKTDGLLGIYGHSEIGLVFLKIAAEDWSVFDAVKSHQSSLDNSTDCEWYTESVPFELDDEEGLIFSYCDKGVGMDKKGNKLEMPFFHLVLTVVKNKMIYRVIISAASDQPILKGSATSNVYREALLEIIESVRFSNLISGKEDFITT